MYLVEKELCAGCGVCQSSCDKGAVSLRNDVAVIDQLRCGECGGCYDTCPQNAVRELNGARRGASLKRPMYGIESPFPVEEAPDPPGPPPSLMKKLTGLALRRRS